MLYDKWWKNDPFVHKLENPKGNGETSSDTFCQKRRGGADDMAHALGVVNIGGIFVVLLCGLAFAIAIAIAEFCHKTSKKNTLSSGVNTIMQTSPNHRNSRRRSATLKIRTRKSLCAEIAGTLLPYVICSAKTDDIPSRKMIGKKKKANSEVSSSNQNQLLDALLVNVTHSFTTEIHT